MRLNRYPSEGGPPVTTAPDPLATRRDELRVLRELNNAAIVARPYLTAAREHFGALLLDGPAADVMELEHRLDAAIADAGELLAEVSS